jgi:hypothetical protein
MVLTRSSIRTALIVVALAALLSLALRAAVDHSTPVHIAPGADTTTFVVA